MQLTLHFEAGIVDSYSTCREYVAQRVHNQGRPQKSIAADMDYSPSHLNRKLAQGDNDTARFTLDDLERFIAVTGDVKPLLYLAEKYLAKSQSDAGLDSDSLLVCEESPKKCKDARVGDFTALSKGGL